MTPGDAYSLLSQPTRRTSRVQGLPTMLRIWLFLDDCGAADLLVGEDVELVAAAR